jgi:hypothetical protein
VLQGVKYNKKGKEKEEENKAMKEANDISSIMPYSIRSEKITK